MRARTSVASLLPRSAARMALTVVAFGTFTSKGSAFSAATRTRSMRTASDTEIPIPASAFGESIACPIRIRTEHLPQNLAHLSDGPWFGDHRLEAVARVVGHGGCV